MPVLMLLLATAMLPGPIAAASPEAGRAAANADGRVVPKATNAPAVGCDPSAAPLFSSGFELDRVVSVGPAGGTVTSANGTCAVIPAGALAAVTDIGIAVAAAGTAPAFPPAGIIPLGDINAFTPHGTTFLQPVTIRVPINPAAVPAGTTPRLYRADPGGSFAAVPGVAVNGSFLEAQVLGFSFFGAGAGVPPTVAPLAPQTTTGGGSATFAAITTGSGPLAFTWTLNGSPVGSGTFTSGACTGGSSTSNGGATLLLANVAEACDGATIAVSVSDGLATVESSTTLAVNILPVITQAPQNAVIQEGQPAVFTAEASGRPAPTFEWSINGVGSAGSSFGSCQATASVSNGGRTLTLTGASLVGCNGALVTVVAVNASGNSMPASARLTVTPRDLAPTDITVSTNAPGDEGQTVAASVTATGSNLTHQWMLTFDSGASARAIPNAVDASYVTPILTQGYTNAGLMVRVCSGAQPTGSGTAPNCAFSAPEPILGETFAVGAQGACFGPSGPNGWCYRSPTPQGNDLTGVVLPTDSEPMIAVGYGTVLESNDFGTNWTARFPTPRLDFSGLARVPGSARLLAPVAATTTPAAVDGGLYGSDDRGTTWSSELLVTAPNTVNDVAFADNGQGVAVGTGIWRSAANGSGWTPVSTAAYLPPETLLRVAMRGGTVLAVSDASAILRSIDGGATWTRVYSGTGERLIDVALEGGGGGAVVVAEGRNYVLVSSNGGESWVQRTVPTFSAQAVGIDPNGGFVMIDSITRSYYSVDFGQSWFTISQPARSSILRWRLAIGDAVGGEAIAVGTYGAMIRSGSGAQFHGIGGGSGQAAVITAIESSPAGNLLMIRGGRVGRSTDAGDTWSGFGQLMQSVSWVGDSTAFGVVNSGGSARLYRSDDGGETFTELSDQSGDTLTGLSMVNSGVGILIGTRAGQPRVFLTTNGVDWQPLPGLSPSGFMPRSVRALRSDPFADPLATVVLVGGDNGQLLRSPDGGQSWFEVNIGTFGSIRHIAAGGPATAVAATDEGLYQTTDGGQNWIRVAATGVMTSVAVGPGGCVATGALGLLVGPDCGSVSVVEPYRGIANAFPPPLLAAAWPTTNNVLAGGQGGTLLINRNAGAP